MARGDHPQRTPFYGGVLIIGAMLASTAVTEWISVPTGARIAVYLLSLLAAGIGILLTFRDLP